MRRIVKLALAAIVMTSSAAAVSVTPATATEWGPPASADCVSTTGAKACFEAYGDRVWVMDTKADGHWALARIKPDDAQGYSCFNELGAGTWEVCEMARYIPEHRWADFDVWRLEGNTTLNQSKVIRVRTT